MSGESARIWRERVIIPTYGVGLPDKNPMYLEKRVYQGSSGAVYPLAVIESIADEKEDREYDVVYLENEYLKLMVMPSLGGRVQMALDKTNDFHFIYYNRVIKPALVGLTGPWLSGGIEFNWPQHHRPSTFEPVDYTLETREDGGVILWVSEIERLTRTKGMAGFTLYPGRACLEIRVQLYNRTAEPQTFLWWANPAMAVDDNYQSIFPPDVQAVYDHGRRDVSTFPIATGTYYKMDYSSGVDISRFKNIPVPTSYMAAGSKYNFMGGYDHGRQAGMLHYADRHVSPGKKQWVWGCGAFGDAWHRNLTDADGPYVELMAGVFTDNQPDFSWLAPYEEKGFTQYFMPYKGLGAVKNASVEAAVNLELSDRKAVVGVYVTSPRHGLSVRLTGRGAVWLEEKLDLTPRQGWQREVVLPAGVCPEELQVSVTAADGRSLVSYRPEPRQLEKLPEPARPIGKPGEILNNEGLYLAGLHLEQYRHATRDPEPYYQEALRRDPGDSRCNNALGLRLYRQGRFELAEPFFRRAIQRQTRHNPNPYDGEPYYNLGLTLRRLGRLEEACDAFYKATWNGPWQDAGFFELARLAAARGERELALEHVDRALGRNHRHHQARHLSIMLLRQAGRRDDAMRRVETALELDRLDLGAWYERALLTGGPESLAAFRRTMRDSAHNYLEIAIDYAVAGNYRDAIGLLADYVENGSGADIHPMVFYSLGYYAQQAGDDAVAAQWYRRGGAAPAAGCFPHRLEEIAVLQGALAANGGDGRAWFYLGNLWYGRRQYELAIAAWERARDLENGLATVHRNLGLAYFNKRKDPQLALTAYERAFELDRTDARVLLELDQLRKKLGTGVVERLAVLEENRTLTMCRDDLCVDYVSLLNLAGRYPEAEAILMNRRFHPWEGGEGRVTGAWVACLTGQAREAIARGHYRQATAWLERARVYPENLGEGKLQGCREADVKFWLGLAAIREDRSQEARGWLEQAAAGRMDLDDAMYYNDQPPDQVFYQGLALRQMGDEAGALRCFNGLLSHGRRHFFDEPEIDFFAVSLPDFLIFDENLVLRNERHCRYLMGLGYFGLGRRDEAAAEFDAILAGDPAHAGAVVHRSLLDGRLL